jgi:hypothetical protein
MLARKTSFVSILYKAEEEPTILIPNHVLDVKLGHENYTLIAFIESPLRGLTNLKDNNLCTWQRLVNDEVGDTAVWTDVTSTFNDSNGKLTHTIALINKENIESKWRVKVTGSTLGSETYPTKYSQDVIFIVLDDKVTLSGGVNQATPHIP